MKLLLALTACLATSSQAQDLSDLSGGIRQLTSTLLSDLGKLIKLPRSA